MNKTKNEDIERAVLKISATQDDINEMLISLRNLEINLINIKNDILVMAIEEKVEEAGS